MKRTNFHAMLAIVVGLCVSSVVIAQNTSISTPVSEMYLISAKAGGVNFLEGNVTVIRASGTSGVLLKRDRVEIGDRVSTGADGRAEILLNPGSYIRLGKNSSFEFGSTDLEDLQITLDSGSAIFEVFADDEFRVSVFTPKGNLALVDTGIYRVDVSTDGTALLSVSKGKAEVGEANTTLIKGGRTGTVGMNTVAVAKFDKDKRDVLGEWSKTRSKELAKIASNLQNKNLSRSLLNTYNSGLWGLNSSFGLWIYDARYGGHCFLPFGSGWRSPYGHWYWNAIDPWQLPPRYNQPPPRIPSTQKVRTSSDNVVNRNAKVRNDDPVRSQAPPFTKVTREGGEGFGSGGRLNSKGSDNSSPSFSSPSYAPSMSAPASTAPSTAKGKDN